MTPLSRLPRTPRSIVILDRRPEYARLLVALVATEVPTLPVAAFDDLATAEAWIAASAMPVAVFADVAAADAVARAESWRRSRAGVVLIAMYDENVDGQAEQAAAVDADATLIKPCCRSDWRRSVARLLGVEEVLAVPV